MSFLDFINHIYLLIGPAGVTLIVLSIVALYLALKNAVFLWLTGKDFHKAAKLIEATPENRDLIMHNFSNNPVVAIIHDILKTHGEHSDDLKAEVAYLFHKYFSKSQRDITFVRVIAVIAPLLGLLGTLLGLLGVFQVLAHTSASSTSTVLAAGIWEAIITTVQGLTLAIPSLIAYYLLSLKMRSFHLAAIEFSYRFLECKPVCRKKPDCSEKRTITERVEEAMVA